MIALLRGRIRGKSGSRALIVEAAAVGYLVVGPPELLSSSQVGDDIELWCVTVMREESLSLYGFATLVERNLFEALIGVRLIGPALALLIVTTLRVEDLIEAVETNQTAMLCTVPGIGEKTAAKILFELSSKIAAIRAAVGESAIGNTRRINVSGTTRREVESALLALGFDAKEIRGALAMIPSGIDTESALRLALGELSS